MIRGHIDFSLLQRGTPPPVADKGPPISLPGFRLEFDQKDATLHIAGYGLLLVAGHPRVRDASCITDPREDDGRSFLGLLCRDPDRLLNALAGRFALLWVDFVDQRIGLASDRFNTRGFCHAREGGRLSFSDRADAVPASRLELDPQGVFDYLYFHTIPAPATIFRGVRRLEPGARLSADAHGTNLAPWWQPQFQDAARADFPAQAQTFRTLVQNAIERELDGSPVASFLSGGTDSSTVVGMLSRTGTRVTAYSIGFAAEGYDEMAYAKLAARHFGVPHRPYYITPEDLVTHIPEVAASYDQPFGNSSVLPAYLCAWQAREDGHTKMFAGDGGDELFGGNSRYAKQRVFECYSYVPGLLKRGLLEPILLNTGVRRLPLLRKAASYVEQASTPMPDRTARYNLLDHLGVARIFQPDFLAAIDQGAPLELQRGVWASVRADSLINKMLGFDWRFTLADNDLPKVLGSTKLAGIEPVFPLLDDELVDFSLGLPPEFKLKGLQLRWFFKHALADFLPPQILKKKKQGFGLPFGHWMLQHRPLQALARESASPLLERGIVRADFIDELFSALLPKAPEYYGEMAWIMMMLGQWLQAHDKPPDSRAAGTCEMLGAE